MIKIRCDDPEKSDIFGITHAEKILVLVGTRKALPYTVRNITIHKRNTMLK